MQYIIRAIMKTMIYTSNKLLAIVHCRYHENAGRWSCFNSSPPSAAYMSVNRVGIGWDNGSPPIRHRAIIWTNDGLLSIGPLRTNFSEILIKIRTFTFTKMRLKNPSAK